MHKSDFTHVQHQAISAQTEYIYTRIVGLQVLLLQDGQINIVVHILHLRLVRNTMFLQVIPLKFSIYKNPSII
jgi:hypothetical protein